MIILLSPASKIRRLGLLHPSIVSHPPCFFFSSPCPLPLPSHFLLILLPSSACMAAAAFITLEPRWPKSSGFSFCGRCMHVWGYAPHTRDIPVPFKRCAESFRRCDGQRRSLAH